MAEIVLFHHAQGLTDGVKSFADTLRGAGHTVHLPDLYDGHTFDSLDDGLAFAKQTGFAAIGQRGIDAVNELPSELVYAGFSLGVMPAQELAQTRPGAVGAVFAESCLPISGEWAIGPWPDGVPVEDETGRRSGGLGPGFRQHFGRDILVTNEGAASGVWVKG